MKISATQLRVAIGVLGFGVGLGVGRLTGRWGGDASLQDGETEVEVAGPGELVREAEATVEEFAQADLASEGLLTQEIVEVPPRSSIYQVLTEQGLCAAEIHDLVQVARPHLDLGRVSPGLVIELRRTGENAELLQLRFHTSPRDNLLLDRASVSEKWVATPHQVEVQRVSKLYHGRVERSLWQSAVEAGLDGESLMLMSDVFAWQVDFSRQAQPGDRWRVLIERDQLADGTLMDWGHIIAAEYDGKVGLYRALRYESEDGSQGYFDPEGDSLRGRFLKSPLKYSRISSGFAPKRFHPILKVNRPHLGVDYAAKTGTPVRAVGDGEVRVIGRRGGNGNMIRIRHNHRYETAYKHLSGFAHQLRAGSRVKQGQVIGYVGSTGLATGPHLHFEFFENGRYIDPLGVKVPRHDPVPETERERFRIATEAALQQLLGSQDAS